MVQNSVEKIPVGAVACMMKGETKPAGAVKDV